MQKGNILKDSFYKQRLIKSNNPSIYTRQQLSIQQPAEDGITAGQQQIDIKTCLSKFAKVQNGSNYAFLQFNCTHKLLQTIWNIKEHKYLQEIDLSYNKLKTLTYLSGLLYLTKIKATNNQLQHILDIKVPPLHLDSIDLTNNQIKSIPDLSKHQYLRVMLLKTNQIQKIQGITNNRKLQILDLSENQIQQVTGLDHLLLTELYLSSNKIEKVKGFNHLEQLRVLDLSCNKISKLYGLINLISLRILNLSKNNLAHVRQIDYLENLMFLTSLDLCYNSVQQRRYYRLQVIYKMPMLYMLDGTKVQASEVVEGENLYGIDVEEKFNIFKRLLPEEEFIDRRIHTSELIENETDSEGEHNKFIDEYDDQGNRTSSKQKNKSMYASKRSMFSKNSKQSKRSNFSKP